MPEPRRVRIHGTNYDGTDHWQHPATLIEATDELIVTMTSAGLEIQTEAGIWVSPFNTTAHYWPERYYNVIRLEEPGHGLSGFYCNIASPAQLNDEVLRYVDLQLDVRVFANEDGSLRYEVWDEDEFEAARECYAYPDELVESCRAALQEVIAMVEARAFPFDT